MASGQLALGVQVKLDFLPFPCGAGTEGSDRTGRPRAVCVALRTTCPMNPVLRCKVFPAGDVIHLVPPSVLGVWQLPERKMGFLRTR